jgi:hypothetical protein
MEFTYRISEEDYVAARKLREKGSKKRSIASVVTQLWLLTLYIFLILQASSLDVAPQGAGEPARMYSIWGHIVQGTLLLAFLALAFVSCRIIFLHVFRSRSIRRKYAREYRMHSDIVIRITPQDYWIHYTFGQVNSSGWNVFKCWEQDADLLLLYYPSNLFVIVKMTELNGEERAQLLGIVGGVLKNRAEAA